MERPSSQFIKPFSNFRVASSGAGNVNRTGQVVGTTNRLTSGNVKKSSLYEVHSIIGRVDQAIRKRKTEVTQLFFETADMESQLSQLEKHTTELADHSASQSSAFSWTSNSLHCVQADVNKLNNVFHPPVTSLENDLFNAICEGVKFMTITEECSTPMLEENHDMNKAFTVNAKQLQKDVVVSNDNKHACDALIGRIENLREDCEKLKCGEHELKKEFEKVQHLIATIRERILMVKNDIHCARFMSGKLIDGVCVLYCLIVEVNTKRDTAYPLYIAQLKHSQDMEAAWNAKHDEALRVLDELKASSNVEDSQIAELASSAGQLNVEIEEMQNESMSITEALNEKKNILETVAFGIVNQESELIDVFRRIEETEQQIVRTKRENDEMYNQTGVLLKKVKDYHAIDSMTRNKLLQAELELHRHLQRLESECATQESEAVEFVPTATTKGCMDAVVFKASTVAKEITLFKMEEQRSSWFEIQENKRLIREVVADTMRADEILNDSQSHAITIENKRMELLNVDNQIGLIRERQNKVTNEIEQTQQANFLEGTTLNQNDFTLSGEDIQQLEESLEEDEKVLIADLVEDFEQRKDEIEDFMRKLQEGFPTSHKTTSLQGEVNELERQVSALKVQLEAASSDDEEFSPFPPPQPSQSVTGKKVLKSVYNKENVSSNINILQIHTSQDSKPSTDSSLSALSFEQLFTKQFTSSHTTFTRNKKPLTYHVNEDSSRASMEEWFKSDL